jgi:hypothetical protein
MLRCEIVVSLDRFFFEFISTSIDILSSDANYDFSESNLKSNLIYFIIFYPISFTFYSISYYYNRIQIFPCVKMMFLLEEILAYFFNLVSHLYTI